MKWMLLSIFSIISGLANAQSAVIRIIDFYGNRSVSESLLRQNIRFHEGDSMSFEQMELKRDSSVVQLRSIPGVKNVEMGFTCCDDRFRQWMLFIGIDEGNAAVLNYHKTPGLGITIPTAILEDYTSWENAQHQVVARGAAYEDHSKGHALSDDSSVRIWQLKFIGHADTHFSLLKNILHNARDANQRSIAAHLIAYSSDKKKVVPELMDAIYDSNDVVRNNATRALSVLASYAQENARAGIVIPAGPFIQMINSIFWTDRNKGSLVLLALTQSRDKQLLNRLRKESLPALTEMARWKNPGHAYASFFILGRIAGVKEDVMNKAFFTNEKDKLLQDIEQKIKNAK